MMDSTEIGRFLTLEGAIVLACMGLRVWCAHRVVMEEIPRPLRRRVELGNRVTPTVTAAAALCLVVGALIWLL